MLGRCIAVVAIHLVQSPYPYLGYSELITPEAEKAELEIALMKSEDCIEASQLQLREVEMTLEEMQRELEAAYKSREMIENQLISMEEEAQKIFAKVDSLEE
ncbi:hypothetical protein K1719_028293 [Acacia pycnantha]|nr:hypothetical protein K1719_028293 [Acacia pycnantha]